MAIYPAADWRPLPENAKQPAIRPTQVILHTAVDHPGRSDLYNFFGRDDVTVESHFWVYVDGTVDQFIDTEIRADANLNGNSRAISIETEDEGDPEGNPWTDAQIAAIVDILDWCHHTHDIPLEVMPAWNAPGLGWHSMWGFADPFNLTGPKPNPWTPSLGKTCPGKTRIGQFVDEVLPMLTADEKDAQIAELEAEVADRDAKIAKQQAVIARVQTRQRSVREDLQRFRERAARLQAENDQLRAVTPDSRLREAVDQVKAAVAGL